MNDCLLRVPNETYEQIHLILSQYQMNPIKNQQLLTETGNLIQRILTNDMNNIYVLSNEIPEFINKVLVLISNNTVTVNTENGPYVIPFSKMCTQEYAHLPRLIDFNEFSNLLNSLNRYTVDPHLQINLPAGYSIVTLYDVLGNRYLLQARYDPNTQKVYQ